MFFNQKAYIDGFFKKDAEGRSLFLLKRRWYIIMNKQYLDDVQTFLQKEFKFGQRTSFIMMLSSLILIYLGMIPNYFHINKIVYSIIIGISAILIFLTWTGLLIASIFYEIKKKALYKKLNLIKTELRRAKLIDLTMRRMTLRGLFLLLIYSGLLAILIDSKGFFIVFLIVFTTFIILKITNKQKT